MLIFAGDMESGGGENTRESEFCVTSRRTGCSHQTRLSSIELCGGCNVNTYQDRFSIILDHPRRMCTGDGRMGPGRVPWLTVRQ